MRSNTVATLVKILVCLTFFVPILVLRESYIFPFIVPKIVVFRTLALLMLAGYILLLVSNYQEYRLKYTWISIGVGLFFASFAISTFAGVDWYRSFWDNHERMLGLFTIFHYVIYYVVLTSVVREWKDWKWILRVFLLAGSIVMCIGIWQRYVDPNAVLNRGSERVSATLGNAIYYSGYGVFLFFVGLLLALKEKVKTPNKWFWYAVLGSTLGLVGVFLGGTRGAILGLMVGLGVLCISYLFAMRKHANMRRWLMGSMVIGVCVLGLLFTYRKSDFVMSIPGVGRLMNVSLTEGTGETRLMAWDIAIEAWTDKPFFGWGPNNYYYAFNEYYRPEFLNFGWSETWFDNAHSIVMNSLATQGLVGITLLLGLFVVSVFVLWKAFRDGHVDIHVASILSAFLIAHFIGKALVFEDPTSYLYFFFALAFINSQVKSKGGAVLVDKKREITTLTTVGVCCVAFLIIFSTNINPARANKATLNTMRVLNQSPADAVTYFDQSQKIPTPHVDDIRNDVARGMAQVMQEHAQSGEKLEYETLYTAAYEGLKKNRILHPLDIRINIQMAQLDQLMAQVTQDSKYVVQAITLLEDAKDKSPKRQQVLYQLSALYAHVGDTDRAKELLEQSVEDNGKISEGWMRLAVLYNQMGEKEKVQELINLAKQKDVVFSDQQRQILDSFN